MHFDGHFIAQKLQSTPNLLRVVHLFGPQIWILKDLGPVSIWSCGHSLSRGVYNTKVVVYAPKGT